MENKYMEVPNDVITGKDLDYLSDMFNWNYGALKEISNSIENTTIEEVRNVLQRGITLFNNNINSVLNILNGGITNE